MSVKEKELTKTETTLSKPYILILHNDDYNSFDWVIKCLVSICSHSNAQASQCAHIVHFSGKCDVKYGYKEELVEMKEKLVNKGLIASVEKNN